MKNIKKILSVEYNIAHDIIRPSIYKHFKELGYDVEFLLAESNTKKRWNFFTRINDEIKTTTVTYDEMDRILTSNKIREFDFIIFNTSFSFMPDFKNINMPIIESIYKNTGKIPNPKYGFLTIPPHVSGYFKGDKRLLKNNKYNGMYVLNHVGYRNLPMLSANWFGKVNITSKSKENIFLATGNIAPHQKNHKLLITAVDKLVKDGITNFKIVINGVGEKLEIPENLKKYFNFLGENKPDKLFEIIESCDFITALLDSSVAWQKEQYGHGTCSCVLMYSLGFIKPLIIEDYFACNYGLDKKNSLIYKGQNLYFAMKRAILLSSNEYQEIQKALKEYSDKCTIQTLKDLKKTLEISKVNSRFDKFNVFKSMFLKKIKKLFKQILNVKTINKDKDYKIIKILGFKIKIK
ncbi:MAG: hypothetical protein II816_05190, partial [Elusimicrobia bacterium]|nr:hypothetical protein [Elusimicrobiota bacterium]